MSIEHPITPPPELVQQWGNHLEYDDSTWFYENYIATQAARWGADQELEACVNWIKDQNNKGGMWKLSDLRAARRPKPPSIKQQAFDSFDFIGKAHAIAGPDWAIIRRALEALPDD